MNRRQALAVLVASSVMPYAVAAPDEREARLIEQLIELVGSTKEITFIRNGDDATPQAAAKHLREKYDYFHKDIVTADDFIRLCGTRSEMTKKPYEVRFPDGRRQPAAEWLAGQLKRLRAAK
jgi:hypothetical protein